MWKDEYFVCAGCDRLFWRGTHWERIERDAAAGGGGVRRGLLVNLALGLGVSVVFLAALEGAARLVEKPRPPDEPRGRRLHLGLGRQDARAAST